MKNMNVDTLYDKIIAVLRIGRPAACCSDIEYTIMKYFMNKFFIITDFVIPPLPRDSHRVVFY